MPEPRTGTGPFCNSSEELVAILTDRLTLRELQALASASSTVLTDSVARAYAQKGFDLTVAQRFADQMWGKR